MPLVSPLCGLPRVKDGVVNLHWEQWRFCSGVWLRRSYRGEFDYAAIL